VSAAPFENIENPLDKILANVKELAVLPQVVFKIMESTSNTDTSAGELEKNIQVDPGFSAKVLKIANSAHYALPKKVTSIREAVQFLGFKQVRQLAINAGVFDMFAGKNDKESLRRRSWWRTSLDSAVCCKWMSSHFKQLNSDEGYTVALLHLIGKTILDKSDSDSYAMVTSASERGIPDYLAERHFFSVDHGLVAEAVCAKWGLPKELYSAVNYIEPPQEGDSGVMRACLALSHGIANIAVNGISDEKPIEELFQPWAIEYLNISSNLREWVDAGVTNIANNKHFSG